MSVRTLTVLGSEWINMAGRFSLRPSPPEINPTHTRHKAVRLATTLEPLHFRPATVQSDIPTITVRAMMLNRARFKAAALTAKWLYGLPTPAAPWRWGQTGVMAQAGPEIDKKPKAPP